MSLDTMAAS